MDKRVYKWGLQKVLFATPWDLVSHVRIEPSAFDGLEDDEAEALAEDVATGRTVLVRVRSASKTLQDFEAEPLVMDEEEVLEELLPLEIELFDDRGRPVAHSRYEVHLPDGRVRGGRLDEHGFARLDSVPAGTSTVVFPDMPPTVKLESTGSL